LWGGRRGEANRTAGRWNRRESRSGLAEQRRAAGGSTC
jgi:hypothetical protein